MKGNDFNILMLAVGVAGLVCALYSKAKADHVCETVEKKVSDLSEDMEIDIPDSIVRRAVDKAVDREVRATVKKAADSALAYVEREIRTDVKRQVDATCSDLKPSVSRAIKRQIGSIDISDVKDEIVSEAKDKIAEKFDSELDDILKEFNGNLETVSKIYKSISSSFSGGKENKEMVFRLS